MLGQGAPEFPESFNLTITAVKSQLEFIRRMDINDRCQTLRQDQVKRAVEILQVFGFESAGILPIEQGGRLDGKANVVKADAFDQREVLPCSMCFEMNFRIIPVLREPVTQIVSAPQPGKSRLRKLRLD